MLQDHGQYLICTILSQVSLVTCLMKSWLKSPIWVHDLRLLVDGMVVLGAGSNRRCLWSVRPSNPVAQLRFSLRGLSLQVVKLGGGGGDGWMINMQQVHYPCPLGSWFMPLTMTALPSHTLGKFSGLLVSARPKFVALWVPICCNFSGRPTKKLVGVVLGCCSGQIWNYV